jgi:ribose transport system permease protein
VAVRSRLNTHDVARWGRSLVPYLGLILVYGFFAITQGRYGFATWSNAESIVEQIAPVAVMAMGYTFTLGGGEMDLSIGGTVALVALTAAVLLQTLPAPLAVAASLGVGAAVGLTNGLLTVLLRVPSFLITLGMATVVTGLAERLTSLQAVAITNQGFNSIFGSGAVGPLPSLLLWVVGILVLGHLVLRKTRFGRHVLAVGGNREAAASLGLPVARIRVSVLVISSLAAALAGLLYAG